MEMPSDSSLKINKSMQKSKFFADFRQRFQGLPAIRE